MKCLLNGDLIFGLTGIAIFLAIPVSLWLAVLKEDRRFFG